MTFTPVHGEASPRKWFRVLLHGKVITDLVAAKGKAVTQVILRWHIQHGHIVFPTSMHRERRQENLGAFDFELLPPRSQPSTTWTNGKMDGSDPLEYLPSSTSPSPRR